VGPRAVLDIAVVKRKISSPRRESNPRTLDLNCLGWGHVAGCCEHVTEPSGSIKEGVFFFDYVRDY